MSAPVSGILDNFNRANEGPPPSADWTQVADAGVSMRVLTNAMTTPSGSSGVVYGVYWDTVTFGPDCEVYVTISDSDGDASSSYGLELRLQGPGAASRDGYFVEWVGNGDVGIYRVDNGGYTQLGTTITGQTMADGHKLDFTMTGSTLQAWKDTGSGWTQMGTDRTDSTYTGAGYIDVFGYQNGSTAIKFDDFGGGTLGGASIKYPRLERNRRGSSRGVNIGVG